MVIPTKMMMMTSELPFKISAQSKGAQKAFVRITDHYGKVKGTEIFLKRAEEHGIGKTVRQKVNSVYKKGGKFESSSGEKGN